MISKDASLSCKLLHAWQDICLQEQGQQHEHGVSKVSRKHSHGKLLNVLEQSRFVQQKTEAVLQPSWYMGLVRDNGQHLTLCPGPGNCFYSWWQSICGAAYTPHLKAVLHNTYALITKCESVEGTHYAL